MRIPLCKFICRQWTGPVRKTACDDDIFLTIPWRIICHYFGMSSNVLWGQLWQLIWLCVYPTQWFHLLEVLMLWQLGWQVYSLMSAPLRCHHNSSDFLYMRIIRWTATIQVTGNLKHIVIDCEFFSAMNFGFVSTVHTICTYSLSQVIVHVVNYKLLTHKGPDSTPRQSRWDVWWTECHWIFPYLLSLYQWSELWYNTQQYLGCDAKGLSLWPLSTTNPPPQNWIKLKITSRHILHNINWKWTVCLWWLYIFTILCHYFILYSFVQNNL